MLGVYVRACCDTHPFDMTWLICNDLTPLTNDRNGLSAFSVKRVQELNQRAA